MAAPLRFCRVVRQVHFHINLQFVRTTITPPYSLYPLKDYRYKKPKEERIEYVDDAPFATKTWEELQGLNTEESQTVDIGEAWIGHDKAWLERLNHARTNAEQANTQNQELQIATKLDQHDPSVEDIEDIYAVESMPMDTVTVAKHYGIYRDLFNNALFMPVTDLQVFYDEDEEHVIPVARGNAVFPSQAVNAPHVRFAAEDDTLYTLVLTNPDGHLTDNNSEYLHWMISNIRDGDVNTGDVVCDYLRPFPTRGTGWHRYVFVLYKQTKTLDLTRERRPHNCSSLKERTFKTTEFYGTHQEDLIPVGVSFFQTEWDTTVQHTFHHVLNMREPNFQYDHPPEYRAPQQKYPHKQPFDRYMDKYRDRKDLAEEAIKERMKVMSPFEPPNQIDTYGRAYQTDFKHKPTWLQRKEELRYRRVEYFKDMDVET